jgi:hypothetical protein
MQHPRFLKNIAPPRRPFVVKLLDPSAPQDIPQVSPVKTDSRNAESESLAVIPAPGSASQPDPDAVDLAGRLPLMKRARFAEPDPEDSNTPFSPRESKDVEETPTLRLAPYPSFNDRKPSMDVDRPRKKAKVTFSSIEDA